MKFSLLLICTILSACKVSAQRKFPDDFLFGTAAAAYQIEGAWNISGKGENIWDRYTHDHPYFILDRSNGDVACDSYHKLKEDIEILKQLKVQFYRFSLSWSRILPTGLAYKVNPDGIRYYNELIDLLLENNIIPMITLLHWDTPQPLEDLGGFTNELMVDWFADYARVCFEHFGDRVKLWLTLNEPKQTCLEGIGKNDKAPGYNSSGIGDYLCAHNLIKAHAKAYHIYHDEFKPTQGGKISITLDSSWFEPHTDSDEDRDAAERHILFQIGLYADPIFHPDGDYPAVMKTFIAERSKKEGFSKSRLPEFTKEEIEYIKGTYDYFGFNHYTTWLVENVPEAPIGDPSHEKDCRTRVWQDPSWPETSADWFKVVPWGFTKVLRWIKDRYGDVEIYVTENGCADLGQLEDTQRVNYYRDYLNAMLDAMYTYNVNVKAYAAWSFLDNFEWKYGYVVRFGLYHVDFNDPNRKRTPKASAAYYRSIIENRTIG